MTGNSEKDPIFDGESEQKMAKTGTNRIMQTALQEGIVIPAFNIPYLPMVEPTIRALADTETFGLIAVARLEWIKFESGSLKAVRDEYEKHKDERFTRLHLDHMPVIDEDNVRIDYEKEIAEAIELGYESVMVDGSRLPLPENIAATRKVVELAHDAGIPVEAELGAILGHGSGPLPPYEDLFASGEGFTDPKEAQRFVEETGVDWLSVAIGNIHGAISKTKKDQKKVEARLSIERLREIRSATDVPIVLHGGTGIRKQYILDSIQNGIAKINIATATRQPYERHRDTSVEEARQAVYEAVKQSVVDDLEIAGSAKTLLPEAK